MSENTEREAFEKFISSPPFEEDVARFPDDPDKFAWPGSYRDINVDRAWECWTASRKLALEKAKATADAWTRADAIKLAAGEMTAQELRTAQAVAKGIAAAIGYLIDTQEGQR